MPLSREDYARIAALMLGELVQPLKDKGISFSWSDEAAARLAGKAYGGKRGARDLRSVIRREVEDKIASAIVDRGEGGIASIRLENDGDDGVFLQISAG